LKKAKSSDRGSAAKRKVAPKNTDEYLAAVPESARSALNEVRATIRSSSFPPFSRFRFHVSPELFF
jgi:signal transduction histidine kinase